MTLKNNHATNQPLYLPGDPEPTSDRARMIRVDHAGEYGAVRIYAGQLAVLKESPKADIIRHMADQEIRHRERFEEILPNHQVRPSILIPFWHVAGYLLGYCSAVFGERAAMACTVGVEEVIDEHYADQAERLGPEDVDLIDTIEEFRVEELEHRDTALDHDAEGAPAYPLLTNSARSASRLAIWLSERF